MNKKNTTGGYAILFTLIVVSIISSIAIGVSSNVYKQLVLSSLAHDSQIAFYAADTAIECTLYLNEAYLPPFGLHTISTTNPPTFPCGVDDNGNSFDISVVESGDVFNLDSSNTEGSCFKATVDKSDALKTSVEVKGYNVCSDTNARQVERGILVEY